MVLTTRPSASAELCQLCRGNHSRRIEVVGFGKKEIEEYIQCVLLDEKLLSDFKEYLSLYPHIHSVMYVPLNSAIVYESCKSLDHFLLFLSLFSFLPSFSPLLSCCFFPSFCSSIFSSPFPSLPSSPHYSYLCLDNTTKTNSTPGVHQCPQFSPLLFFLNTKCLSLQTADAVIILAQTAWSPHQVEERGRRDDNVLCGSVGVCVYM